MEDWDLVVLVDALPRGEAPGTVYVMEPQLSNVPDAPASLNAHSMDPMAVLQLVNALGGKVERMLVVGCEPDSVELNQEGNIGLSEPVNAAVDEAVRTIQDLITRACSQPAAA
jgi:hydrogenase maturation protease